MAAKGQVYVWTHCCFVKRIILTMLLLAIVALTKSSKLKVLLFIDLILS